MAGAGWPSTSSQVVAKEGVGGRAKPNHDGDYRVFHFE